MRAHRRSRGVAVLALPLLLAAGARAGDGAPGRPASPSEATSEEPSAPARAFNPKEYTIDEDAAWEAKKATKTQGEKAPGPAGRVGEKRPSPGPDPKPVEPPAARTSPRPPMHPATPEKSSE